MEVKWWEMAEAGESSFFSAVSHLTRVWHTLWSSNRPSDLRWNTRQHCGSFRKSVGVRPLICQRRFFLLAQQQFTHVDIQLQPLKSVMAARNIIGLVHWNRHCYFSQAGPAGRHQSVTCASISTKEMNHTNTSAIPLQSLIDLNIQPAAMRCENQNCTSNHSPFSNSTESRKWDSGRERGEIGNAVWTWFEGLAVDFLKPKVSFQRVHRKNRTKPPPRQTLLKLLAHRHTVWKGNFSSD